MLLYQAIIVSGFCAPALIFFKYLIIFFSFLIVNIYRDKPTVPPSSSAEKNREDNFLLSLKTVTSDINFWIVFVGFSIGLGSFNTMATILNQILYQFDYSEVNRNYIIVKN